MQYPAIVFICDFFCRTDQTEQFHHETITQNPWDCLWPIPHAKKNSRYIRCGFKSQYHFGVLGLPIILSKSVYISMPPATIAILIITNPYTSNLTLLSPPFERWKPTCKLHCPSHHNNKMHKNKTKSGLHLLLAPCQKFHIYLPGDSI